ncbi:TonB family protein [Sphingomonas naasensis]|uniref:TonB family protein n=1 Tax=Sphingomonas naasensis TaxID=1344951 RepID=A0A4V3QXE6_9SPHN|nr:energy transducer TonB [Sphingomonas naasensis]NIJ18861.1 TonB family protein [Sphingomonas naasensis]TGX46082.1 TonB family protein [Sphingomonas naasensis]
MILLPFWIAIQDAEIGAAARPVSVPTQWVTSDDYPPIALRYNQEGTVAIALTLDPSGAPTACDIRATSGYVELDNQTCSLLMQRARFAPALDRAGEPTKSTWTSRIRWQLSKVPMLLEQGAVSVRVVVNGDGKVEACHVIGKGNLAKGDDLLCEGSRDAQIAPAFAWALSLAKNGTAITLISSYGMDLDEAAVAPMEAEATDTHRHALAVALFEVDAGGRVLRCVETVRAGSIGLPRNMCARLPEQFATTTAHKVRVWAKTLTGEPRPEDRP